MQHVVIEIFLWLLGLCVGSFLNVVVYRLCVGLSVAHPARSFCPRCRAQIAWYDNLPVLSWLLLRGRCRHCAGPISVQYPLVEALTGLSFVLVYHLLFVARLRVGLPEAALPADLPLLLAWLVLAAGLVACAAMDIVSYTIDIRVTNIVLGIGIVLHALWPRPLLLGSEAGTATAAGTVAVFAVSAIVLWWTTRQSAAIEEDEQPAESDESDTGGSPQSQAARVGGFVGVIAFGVLTAWLICAPIIPAIGSIATDTLPVAAAFAVIFGATVLVGGQRREADEEIHAAIEEERPQARRAVAREMIWLLPPIIVGGLVWAAVAYSPAAGQGWSRATQWTPGGGFTPIGGLAVSIKGAVLAAAAGWLLRIVFTLIYGREAFGVGDIYILAAAGATAGWDIALLGLLLSVGIALLGWLLGLMLKGTVMIPFGPWLALGFVWALWWNRPAQDVMDHYLGGVTLAWQQRPDMVLAAGGLLLVGSAAAIVLSRLVRRWVAPDSA